MNKMNSAILFTVFCIISVANSEIIFSEFNTDIDQCKDVCADSFFLLPKIKEAQNICQRGCRFFNIIYLKDDHDLNITKEECYLSCEEAYKADLKPACNTGCDAMSKKKESELSSILIFIEQDNPKNIMLVEPELELLESELISDPLIQSQIEIGYNIEYKIPETKIRTMPIEEFVELAENKPTGDWLDCASRNSGIPKWILLTAILSAILIALWLSISSEKKVISDDLLDDTCLIKNDEESDDEDFLNDEDEADELPVKDDLEDDKEIKFSCPPKYIVETETV